MKRAFIFPFIALSLSSCGISMSSFSLVKSESSSPKDSDSVPSASESQGQSSSSRQIIEKPYSNPLHFYKMDGTEYFVPTADPDILEGDDGYFYLYCTNCNCEMGAIGMGFDRGPIFKSKDMISWTWAGSVFKDYPNDGNWGTAGAGIWAPGVIKVGSKYNYYYSLSTWGDADPGIGVAVGDTPLGPWKHYGKLFDQESSGVANGIDPKPFFADDSLYLMWGSFNGIAIALLTDDGTETFYGESNLRNSLQYVIPCKENGSESWIDNGFEGSFLVRKDGYYYYFGSQGSCLGGANATYNVKTGRSEDIFGPYLDSERIDISSEGHHGDVVIQPSKEVSGTGHNAVIQDAKGEYWLVYHGFDNDGEYPDERRLFIDPLKWDKETGMPYVEGRVASINVEQEGPSYYEQ